MCRVTMVSGGGGDGGAERADAGFREGAIEWWVPTLEGGVAQPLRGYYI